MLWCLLRLSRADVRDATPASGGEFSKATLVLEPTGGGGDAREINGSEVVVTQLKARADQGAWSLQEIIKQVLPDLLKAVSLQHVNPVYEFVTEGHIGRWGEVRDFFEELRGRGHDRTTLSTTRLLRVGATSPNPQDPEAFWERAVYSEAALFAKIVNELGGGTSGTERAALEARVWHLLAHFRVRENLSWDRVVSEIDANLAEVIDVAETILEKRRALTTALAELAASGNVTVDIASFLSDHGVPGLPPDRVSVLLERAAGVLRERLRLRGYQAIQHVQTEFTQRLVSLLEESPVLVITGKSGTGKSWHGYALASTLACRSDLVAHVEAAATARQTLEEALGTLWNRVKQHEATIPYESMAARLPKPPLRRILFIDALESVEVARGLALLECERLGIHLVIGASKEIAEEVKNIAGVRCQVAEAPPFSPSELTAYLAARHVDGWESVPGDLRDVLTNPLLARLYCDAQTDGQWRPTNEYALFQGYWDRHLAHNASINQSLDLGLLRALGRSILAGEAYPWPARVIYDQVKHEQSLERLRRSGWLVIHPGGACSLWHDRLLNWLVAVTLVDDAQDGTKTPAQVADLCVACMNGAMRASGRSLGYVAMDTLWLLGSRGVRPEYFSKVLAGLEMSNAGHVLYSELVPTIGSGAVGGLLARLDEVLDTDVPYWAVEIASCLSRLDSVEAVAKARLLLASKSVERQAIALHIFRVHGDPTSLDRLWTLHLQAAAEPGHAVEYQRRMDAMNASARQRLPWLRSRLSRADATTPGLTDLVYLLARQPGGEPIWRELKEHLKQAVPENKRRCLLRCIMAFADRDEVEFVRAQRSRDEDLAGDMAMAALSRLDPDAAVADLLQTELKFLTLTRGWHLHPLLVARPEATQKAVRALAMRQGFRRRVSDLYQGAENEIDVGSFDLLLDHVEDVLATVLSTERDANSGPLYGPLNFLDAVIRPDLLDRLRARSDGRLPDLLAEYLLAIGPRADISGRLNDRPALRVLQHIGSPRLPEVVLDWLNAPTWYGRIDGLDHAYKQVDERVLARLRDLATAPAADENGRFEAYQATNALCRLGEWDTVIEASIRHGLALSPYTMQFRRGKPALTGSTVESLVARLNAGETLPGLLLAAGLSGDSRSSIALRQVLADDDAARDVFLAAAISAELLGLHDDNVVAGIALRLRDPSLRERLVGILLAMETPAALDVVMQSLREHFDPAVCAALGATKSHAARAAALAWQSRTAAERTLALPRVVSVLARHADPDVRQYLERLAFGHQRSIFGQSARDEAIEALATLDPSRAYDAARGALRDSLDEKRDSLPEILMRLDRDRALKELLELARIERDDRVEIAIADALSSHALEPELLSLMESPEVAARRVGCVLAGRRNVSDRLLAMLRMRAVDTSDRVSSAAMRAVRETARAASLSALVDEWLSNPSLPRRGILLETIVRAARGTKDRPPIRPGVLSPLKGTLDPLELAWATDALNKGKIEFQSAARERMRRGRTA
jgi:hypothetical protein